LSYIPQSEPPPPPFRSGLVGFGTPSYGKDVLSWRVPPEPAKWKWDAFCLIMAMVFFLIGLGLILCWVMPPVIENP